MLISLHDHALVEDLCMHFGRSGFRAVHVGGNVVEVTRPDAQTVEQAEQEIILHLRVWQIANPGADVSF